MIFWDAARVLAASTDRAGIRRQLQRLFCVVLSCALGLGAGCGTPLPPQAPATPAQAPTEKKATGPLAVALAKLPSGESPLSALPADLLAALRAQAAALPEEVRTALLSPEDPVVPLRPLLHLAAGGQALGAYEALCSTAAPGQELLELRLPTGGIADLPEIVNRASQLAAVHLLRERALDVDSDRPPSGAALSQLAVAARTLGLSEVELWATAEWVRREPTASRRLQLARVHTERHEVERATDILTLPELAKHPELPALVERLQAARRLRHAGAPKSIESAIQTARDHLTLGAEGHALSALEPYANSLGTHLGYSTVLARARSGTTACPYVNPGLGNAYFCALGWSRLGQEFELEALDRAWQSGVGRDAQAVEEYLGLRRVVPMTYGAVGAPPTGSPEQFLTALSQLEQDAALASGLAPHFKAVSALARALRTALETALATPASERPVLPAASRAELLGLARQVQTESGKTAWGQAAVLGLLAVVTQEEDVQAQLAELQPDVVAEHLGTLSALSVWHALASGDAPALRRSQDLLSVLILNTDPTSYERSSWLLLWAEASAHLEPSERSFNTLESLAGRLLSEEVPRALRYRAALDVAGLRARRQDFTGAASALESLVATAPESGLLPRAEQELLIAAKAYLIVLRALSSQGAEFTDYAGKLEALTRETNQKGAAPPTLRLWLTLWQRELAYLLRKQKCANNRYCLQQAESVRGIKKSEAQGAVGLRTAELLLRGVLTLGGVEIQFRYQSEGRLQPSVLMDAQFLMPHAPWLEHH